MSAKVCGVTAEFNPFHEGHAHLLREARRITGADFILVLMSPDFVQRGAPAIDDKYARTRAALDAGADCVLEFPVRFAAGSARMFAAAAVSIFSKTGVVDSICFGSENGQIGPLEEMADILAEETPEFRSVVQDALRAGLSYPSAVEKALRETAAVSGASEVPSYDAYAGPNNRLGIEYLIALKSRPEITPYTVPLLPGISASRLRSERLETGGRGMTSDDLSAVLFSRLAEISVKQDPAALTAYEDVNTDLAMRILRMKDSCPSFSALASAVKTKAYTRTRIDRALIHILLGITSDPGIPYLRVLGFRRSFEPVLGQMSEKFPGQLILRSSDEKNLDEHAEQLFLQDRYASELWRGIRMIKYPDEDRKPERSMGVIVK